MAKTPITTARTIANAINAMFHAHVVINVSQFYGAQGKLVRMYVIKDSFYYADGYSDKELFKTASGVYACLFMRDLLYGLQGKDIPHEDNEGYNNILEKKNGLASIEYMKEAYTKNDELEASDT